MLHYMHIQGKYAPAFFFRDKTGQNFKSLIQSLTEGASLVISSLYRTDVFYQAASPHTEEVMKLWSLQEQSFDLKKLTIVQGREDVLEHYFTALVSFSSVNQWYQSYLEEFRLACSLDQNNPILKDLKLCEQYLQASQRTVARPTAVGESSNLLQDKEVFTDLVKHINNFLN